MKYQDKRRCAGAKGLCLAIEQNLGLHASIPLRGGVQNTGLGLREVYLPAARSQTPCWDRRNAAGFG